MAITRQAPRLRLGHERRLGVRLYLDDISDVVTYLRNRGQSVELSSQSATFDTVDDLRDASRHDLELLTIGADPARVYVELHASGARVVTYSDEPESKHLVDEIAEMLGAKKSIIPLFFRKSVRIALLLIVAIAVVSLVQLAGGAGQQRRFAGGLGAVLGVVVVRSLLGARQGAGARIVPHRRAEQRTISRDVWLVLGTAAVTAIVAVVVTYWQVAGD